jgi:hypothetical protein
MRTWFFDGGRTCKLYYILLLGLFIILDKGASIGIGVGGYSTDLGKA